GGERGVRAMSDMGMRMARASDFEEGAIPADVFTQSDGVMFDQLGVACMASTSTRGASVSEVLADMDMVEHVEDEMIRYAIGGWEVPEGTIEYLRGYRDGVNRLVDALLSQMGGRSESSDGPALAPGTPPSEAEFTWGLKMTGVADSAWTGKGV